MNDIVPFQMTGNKPSPKLSGEYLLLLIMFKLIWPHANYCKCIAFIANQSDDARVFPEEHIGKALRRLRHNEGNFNHGLSGICSMQYRSPTTILDTALVCWDSRDLTATDD